MTLIVCVILCIYVCLKKGLGGRENGTRLKKIFLPLSRRTKNMVNLNKRSKNKLKLLNITYAFFLFPCLPATNIVLHTFSCNESPFEQNGRINSV